MLHVPPLLRTLFLPLLASLGLSLFPWGRHVLYPFRLFTTWIHECCHATAALLMGGEVTTITLRHDTSGDTAYRIPAGRLRRVFVASMGYPGATLVGCLLFHLSLLGPKDIARAEIALAILILLTTLIWIRGSFGIFCTLCMSLALLGLAAYGRPPYAQSVFAFLAIQTALGALLDIRCLFEPKLRAQSDAAVLQKELFLPAWCWSTLWLLLSLGAVTWTLLRSL